MMTIKELNFGGQRAERFIHGLIISYIPLLHLLYFGRAYESALERCPSYSHLGMNIA